MKAKIIGYILAVGRYILRKVLPFDLLVLVLIGLSFLIWPGLSGAALSERLVMTGIGISLVAGVLMASQTVGGRTYGIPTFTAAQSSTLIDWNIEIRRQIDERFDFRFRIFFIGAIIFLCGILVDSLSRAF
jgi:hypothetical protein